MKILKTIGIFILTAVILFVSSCYTYNPSVNERNYNSYASSYGPFVNGIEGFFLPSLPQFQNNEKIEGAAILTSAIVSLLMISYSLDENTNSIKYPILNVSGAISLAGTSIYSALDGYKTRQEIDNKIKELGHDPRVIEKSFATHQYVRVQETKNNLIGILKIGMSENELFYHFRSPDEINTSKYSNETFKQLIYKFGDFDTVYVYSSNGVITSFQY